jgi:hypothetical protein
LRGSATEKGDENWLTPKLLVASEIFFSFLEKGYFLNFLVLYSTLLYLPPLIFLRVGGRWH